MAQEGSFLALAPADRGIVVFKVMKSLPYGSRMLLSFLLVAGGLVLQLATGSFWIGAVPLLAGNLLLLVTGYHNRVEYGRWDPDTDWTTVGVDRLHRFVAMDRKIRDWDLSLLDATNLAGGALFVLLAAMLVMGSVAAEGTLRIVFLDGLVLLVPHWMTGVRRILLMPNLLVKARAIQDVLAYAQADLAPHKLDLMMLLSGGERKLPYDVKFRVMPKDAPAGFLGLYGQVVTNDVQGTSYPYFYVVLVAKTGSGLRPLFDRYDPAAIVTKEFKRQGEVEVLVVRQTTTKTFGYHTKSPEACELMSEGLKLMNQAVSRKA